MNGLKMRSHQHRGSALSVPVRGRYLPGAITSRLPQTTLRSSTKTSSWLLRRNAESTTVSLVFIAISLAALNVKQGEKVLHVGAGTGYYTALLARLMGETGTVVAYEVEHDLAQNAIRNLSDLSNVTVQERSGSEAPLPACDAIYVNAGATAPLDVWLDALQLNGRLLFPLTPADGPGGMPGAGGMILVTRTGTDHFDARFVCAAMFVPCFGARDEETAQKLSAAFKRGDSNNVRTLRRNSKPDNSCWCAGNGWWLSTV